MVGILLEQVNYWKSMERMRSCTHLTWLAAVHSWCMVSMPATGLSDIKSFSPAPFIASFSISLMPGIWAAAENSIQQWWRNFLSYCCLISWSEPLFHWIGVIACATYFTDLHGVQVIALFICQILNNHWTSTVSCHILNSSTSPFLYSLPTLEFAIFPAYQLNFASAIICFQVLRHLNGIQVSCQKYACHVWFMLIFCHKQDAEGAGATVLCECEGDVVTWGQVHVSHKLGHPYDGWLLEEQAECGGLTLLKRVPFHKEQFPGYRNRRGQGPKAGDTFKLGEADTYIFKARSSFSSVYVTNRDTIFVKPRHLWI